MEVFMKKLILALCLIFTTKLCLAQVDVDTTNFLFKKNGSGEDKKEVLLHHMNGAFNNGFQTWGPTKIVTFYYNDYTTPSQYSTANIESAINSAISIWNSGTSTLKFSYSGRRNLTPHNEYGYNIIGWKSMGTGTGLAGTRRFPAGNTTMTETDIAFNSDYNFYFGSNPPPINSRTYDFITVMK